jgi:GMP reductase
MIGNIVPYFVYNTNVTNTLEVMKMRIESDFKLDFSDVLIRPKRSTLGISQRCGFQSNYTFKHSQKTWTGIPIMAANMDGVGTFEMAQGTF